MLIVSKRFAWSQATNVNQHIEDAVAELSDASCSTARDKAVDAIMSRADVLRMKDMIRFNGGVVMKQLLDASE